VTKQHLQAIRRWQLAIAAVGASALLAACGPGTTGSAAGPSTNPPNTPAAGPSASCAEITALGTALANVNNITVNARTGSQVSADLTAIETALTALKNDSRSLYTAEAGQIVAGLTVIGKQAQLLALMPTARNLRVTRAAVDQLKNAVNSVTTEMRLACPQA
jgi:hypothetical protein